MIRLLTTCAVALVCTPLFAQSIPNERLNDWEFRFRSCANVIRHAPAIIQMMRDRNLQGSEGVFVIQSEMGAALAGIILMNERGIAFTRDEALFVSDLAFRLVGGMIEGGFDLTEKQLLGTGFDMCNVLFEIESEK